MFRKSLGLSVIFLPLTIQLTAVNAQSWKDWVQKNPTYKESAPTAPAPSTATPPTATPSGTPTRPTPQFPVSNSFEDVGITHPIFEQMYMAGCQRSPRYQQYCQCTLREIQNNYTTEEFITIVEFMEDNQEVPSEMFDIVMACAS